MSDMFDRYVCVQKLKKKTKKEIRGFSLISEVCEKERTLEKGAEAQRNLRSIVHWKNAFKCFLLSLKRCKSLIYSIWRGQGRGEESNS